MSLLEPLISVFNSVYPEAGILIKSPVNLQGKGFTPPYFNATDRADAEIYGFLYIHCIVPLAVTVTDLKRIWSLITTSGKVTCQ